MLLKNKIAFITGAEQGIGKEIAVEMAKQGATVIVTGLDTSKCQKVARQIGNKSIGFKMDITNQEEVVKIFKLATNNFGRLDILVNNAGILQQKPFETITMAEWDKMFEVDLRGAFFCSQEAVKYMQKNKSGRIINISSIGGQWGGNLAVHYSAAKAGVISLTRSLARIYSKDNILTNCITPSLVLTDMSKNEMKTEAGKEKLKNIPLGRAASPKEIADIAIFLASDMASYITGQTINANGGVFFNT